MPIIWQSVFDGLNNPNKELYEMAKIYKLTKPTTFFKIKLPSATPMILTSTVNALGLAWKSGVAAEVICLPNVSLGTIIWQGKGTVDYDEVYAVTITVVILSILLEILIKYLLKKGNIMDFDLLFHTFPNEILPYDYEKLANCKERFEMVTTSCRTGKACYYEEKHDANRVIDIVKASSSLPFVCPITYVDGEPMLDGGIADSIPILRARELGYDNNVVVLTRNKGYRKSEKEMKAVSLFYKEYPAMQEAIRQRNKIYNQQISMIEELEAAGEIVVIRPERPIEVGRMERDTKKLLALYEEGYNIAMRNVELGIRN
jgi:predicted patatin/cPLA2 family phospholipase